MKILHINLERGWYGGERQTLYLMEGLRVLGHENALLARENELFVKRVRESGFTVHVIKKPFLVHGHYLSDFNIVHAHEDRGLQLAALWKHSHRRPVIYTRRLDYIPGKHLLNRIKYGKIDCLVAISEKIKSVMVEWGFPQDCINVIHSSIFLDRISPPNDSIALKQRFQDKKVVGCVASLVRHKDHDTLIEAAEIINRHRNDIVFVLLGEGDLRAALEHKVMKLGLKNIIFEGYQNDPYPYYNIFDVFTMTSSEEGLGSSILDAFLYHVPVVATAAGGIPDFVKDGETGLLVPVKNPQMVAQSILRILDDNNLRLRCTQNAYAMLEQEFTSEKMAQAYDSLYRELTSTIMQKV
jgi:L-malate glycosyltransferase